MSIWYPYTQMQTLGKVPIVSKGKGSFLYFTDGTKAIDAISSWWACIHGYSYKPLNRVLKKQVDTFSHVMLGGLTHQPALQLAEKLVEITPKGLNHVFFSDSGSVAVEVALKMAIQYWSNQGNKDKVKLISCKNSYHGDTFKAMQLSDDSDFTVAFSHLLEKDFVVEIPENPDDYSQALQNFENLLITHSSTIAALIIEPIIQCAGGFKVYSPDYLDALNKLCFKYNVLTIYDEVATGFGRTGKLFGTNHAKRVPDIIVLGKGLTAGYIGHAATIASTKIYQQFKSKDHDKALMHGPTFMGNPLACVVALKSIEIFQKKDYLTKINNIENTIKQFFETIQSEEILDKRVLGAVGIIEVKNEKSVIGFKEFALKNQVFIRPIGKMVYLMPSYRIKKKELVKILVVMKRWFEK